jgi:hypothetical protein
MTALRTVAILVCLILLTSGVWYLAYRVSPEYQARSPWFVLSDDSRLHKDVPQAVGIAQAFSYSS